MNTVSIQDFDSEVAAFDYCRNNPGFVLFFPQGDYNIDGLTMPHYTHLRGAHKNLVNLNGRLLMPNPHGMNVSDLGIETVEVPQEYGLRDAMFQRVRFFGDTGVVLRGATYYNVFDTCKMECRVGFDIGETCNANTIRSGRSNCHEYHILFSGYARGNYIHSVFEGNQNGAGEIVIDGRENMLIACWYERYKFNEWPVATVQFKRGSQENMLLGGARCYLFSVKDEGVGNMILPHPRDPASYDVAKVT